MDGDRDPVDFTRWNRAGLKTLDYLDGNAATFLELIRAGLQQRFPDWTAMDSEAPAAEREAPAAEHEGPATESDAEWKARLEALYGSDNEDLLWQLSRSFARACHVLGRHIGAAANESSLGTASQWDSVRRLVAMLDYTPQPPASAYTPLVIAAKDGLAGTLEAGFQVKYAPADGGAPVLFETLADSELDYRLNALRAHRHDRNPRPLSGATLDLLGEHPKLSAGTPLVLENTETGASAAHLMEGVRTDSLRGTTQVSVSPGLSRGFTCGATLVHVLPKDVLKPLGPRTLGAELGLSLQLTASAGDLKAGEIVAISAAGRKPAFRRLKQVRDRRLTFYLALGDTAVADAAVSRALTVPLTDLADKPHRREVRSDGTVRDVVFAAGDWSWLQGGWVAHLARLGGRDLLPHYQVHKAKYVPVGTRQVMEDEREGFTALTVDWHADRDEVAGEDELALNNPQYLLAVPRSPGPWHSDSFLQRSDSALDSPLVCEQGKRTAVGDFAVLAMGSQLAWGRLAAVDADQDNEQLSLSPEGDWRERGGGPFYLGRTRVYSHFSEQLQLEGWNRNDTPLRGTQVPLALERSSPALALLEEGRSVVLSSAGSSVQTTVRKLIAADPVVLKLAHAVPSGSTRASLVVSANVVQAGHGALRPERVLGSGDATRANQQFRLDAEEVSWVADPGQASGVAAALEVTVAGARWQQVANLRDSGPADAVYTVRLDEDGHCLIGFGDGRHGRRLPTGGNNLRVRYRQGVGAAGNLAAGSLESPVKPHHLVESVSQPLPSAGGAEGESVTDMRDNAPATVLTLSRAVSLTDYAQLARAHASVWQARAFARATGWARRESIEVVVVPADGAPLLPSLESNLLSFLRSHSLPGVELAVRPYESVPVAFELTVRVDAAQYQPDQVGAAVVAAVTAAFSLRQRRLGQALYRSELYQVVEAVTGVVNSSCLMHLTNPPVTLSSPPRQVLGRDGVLRVVKPAERQCLHLDLQRPAVSVTTEEYQP